MTESKQLKLLKAAAIGFALFYVYRLAQNNGGTLDGTVLGTRLNPQRLAKLASYAVPEKFRPHVEEYAPQLIGQMMRGSK